MNNYSKRLITFYLIYFGIGFVATGFIYPSSGKLYEGWLDSVIGSIHGSLLIQNWVISLFDSSRLVKAIDHDSGYNAGWWIGIILMSYNVVKEPISLYLGLKYNTED